MVEDKEHSFATLFNAASIVLSQERGTVEFRQFLLKGPRICVFGLHSLSPELICTSLPAQHGLVCGCSLVSTIGFASFLSISPSDWGVAAFLAWLVAVPLLLYLNWRESKVRWYVFYFLDAGPSFAFPEVRGREEKAREFALQIQSAIRECHAARQAQWEQALKQSNRHNWCDSPESH